MIVTAPAIAFAPRTESREASSVLAHRRRVCGRCVQPSDCVWVVSSIRVVLGPEGRRVETLSDLERSDRWLTSGYAANSAVTASTRKTDRSLQSKNLAGRKPNPCSAHKQPSELEFQRESL